MASPAGCYPAGSVIELADKQAMEIVRSGHAIVVEIGHAKVIETATAIPEIETAVVPISATKKTATKKKGTVKK